MAIDEPGDPDPGERIRERERERENIQEDIRAMIHSGAMPADVYLPNVHPERRDQIMNGIHERDDAEMNEFVEQLADVMREVEIDGGTDTEEDEDEDEDENIERQTQFIEEVVNRMLGNIQEHRESDILMTVSRGIMRWLVTGFLEREIEYGHRFTQSTQYLMTICAEENFMPDPSQT